MADQHEVDPAVVIRVVKLDLAEGWTPDRLKIEIDDAWSQYEVWQTLDGGPTLINRQQALSGVLSSAVRLRNQLSNLTEQDRSSLKLHYPTDDLRYLLGYEPEALSSRHGDTGEIETLNVFPTGEALSRAMDGVNAIIFATSAAKKEWEPETAAGWKEMSGLTAQQQLLAVYLPEIFEDAFGRDFTLSHEAFNKTKGGRFVECVW